MTLTLILAVILAVFGVLQLLSGDVLWAVVLFIAAAVVGPGGYSVFNRGRA